MVDVSEMNKDIRNIAEKVGTAVFTYEEIHNDKNDNVFHYDYQKVIDEVSRLNGRDMTKDLIDRGILKPMPYGEYAVNVGNTTMNGGGLNYGGTAFFAFGEKDYTNKYHELAHSLQFKYNLLNDDKLDQVYANCSTGNPEQDKKNAVDRQDYKNYIDEMHAESFAYAAMMLRAKGPLDFAKQALTAFNSGIKRTLNGHNDKSTKFSSDNPSAKFYMSYPVMKETIKQIWKIRRSGKQGEFFDENGVLKDEKLARLSEQIVLDSAYSPRTLKAIFQKKFKYEHKRNEQGWKRDWLKAKIFKSVIFIDIDSSSRKELLKAKKKHTFLLEDEKMALKKFLTSKHRDANPEINALNEYMKLKVNLNILAEKYGLNEDKNFLKRMDNISRLYLKNGKPPDLVVSEIVKRNALTIDPSEAADDDLRKYLSTMNNILEENKDNPYFQKLIQNSPDAGTVNITLLQKKQNPSAEVINDTTFPNTEEPELFPRSGFMPVLNAIDRMASKYGGSDDFRNAVLKCMTDNIENLMAPDYKQKFDVLYNPTWPDNVPETVKKKYKKDVDNLLKEAVVAHYERRKNPDYLASLEEIKQMPFNQAMAHIQPKFNIQVKKGINEKQEPKQEQATVQQQAPEQSLTSTKSEGKSFLPEEQVKQQLDQIIELSNKHDKSGVLGKLLLHSYLNEDVKMKGLEYWGNLGSQFSAKSPHGQESFVKDMSHIMAEIANEMRTRQTDEKYHEVKKVLSKEKTLQMVLTKSEEMVQTVRHGGKNETQPAKVPQTRQNLNTAIIAQKAGRNL